jgi:GntR family transcriptional regulator
MMPAPTNAIARLLLPHISAADDGPLYQQIMVAIRREVSAGRLAPGTALPSFRVLARELMVSLITVKRAYEELEREGVLVLRQGLGTFVARGGDDASRQAKAEAARRLLSEAVREAREAGLTPVQVRALLRELLEQDAQTEREQTA